MDEEGTMKSFRAAVGGSLRLACGGWLLVLALAGPTPGRDSSPEGSDPIFKALLIDGREVTGRIVSFADSKVTIAMKEGKKEALSFDQLVKLTRESPGAIALGESSQAVLLGDGDRLMRASIGTATDASLEVRSELLGKLDVPLDGILGLVLAATGQAAEFEMLLERIQAEPRTSEVLWLSNGDRLGGSFLEMDERIVKLQVGQKPLEVDRSGVVAVGFDPKLLNYPRPGSAFLEATLSDGTRLGLASIKLVEGNIHATTRFAKPIRFALSELTRLCARSRSVVYLSERAPATDPRYEEYVGPTLPIRRDRAVDGLPMRLGGQTYDRGIGTQSRTLLAYRIEPGDRRFQAQIGVDERAGPLGSVVFRVLVDRRERFKSLPMTDRDPPKALDIDLAGGKILILVTEFGDRGNVRDLADWAEARIIR
jgi:NPCBM/NEW2 domain